MRQVTREQVIGLLKDHRVDLERLHVKSLKLFGSFARGEERMDSDVDLLVEFEGQPTFDRFMDLKLFLEDLLERKVDLVTRRALRSRMQLIIDQDAVHVA
jgi:predicted nucleotidyltransferase